MRVVNKKIPMHLKPIRFLYRMVSKLVPASRLLKHITRYGLEMLVWRNETVGRRLLLTGSYEDEEIKFLDNLVNNGESCLDIGANVGIYSLIFARKVGPSGIVYSFEPVKRNALVIGLAAELNGLENIRVIRSAVSISSGAVSFLEGHDSSYGSIDPSSCVQEGKGVEVTTTSIGDFVKSYQVTNIDFVKIDVEGAEGLVLEGFIELMSNINYRPKVFMIELVDQFLGAFGHSIGTIVTLMHGHEYSPYYLSAAGQLIEFSPKDHNQVFNILFLNDEGRFRSVECRLRSPLTFSQHLFAASL
jgi:FkbM family methyltransferase